MSQRRLLSGFKSLPKKNKTQVKAYDQLTAPEYQLGFKKPETGVLEVETGRIIGDKKEIKIIESDEAYRARLNDARKLGVVGQYLPLLPLFVVMIIIYAYIFVFDAKSNPPAAFEAVYQNRKNKEDYVITVFPLQRAINE